MAKNFNFQDDVKLTQEVQKYKCLGYKSDSGYKRRNHVVNNCAAVELTLNLYDCNDGYSLFLFKYLLHFFIHYVFL